MLKFFLRLINNLAKFAACSLPLQGIGAIALAVYIPFAKTTKANKSLPYCLRWFDCADFYFDRDTSTYLKVIEQGKWARYCWLAWRNPINYFNYKYMGFYMDDKATIVGGILWDISQKVGDATGCVPGYFHIEVLCSGKIYYEYYYILKYSDTTCLRFRMGWKIGQNPILVPGYVQDVFVVAPYKSYSGK